LDPLLHTRLQPSKFFNELLPLLEDFQGQDFAPTLNAWSLVERVTVIDLYERFFFLDADAYPMFHVPGLNDLPVAFSVHSHDGRGEHSRERTKPATPVSSSYDLRKDPRSANPDVVAGASKAVVVAAAPAASKAGGAPKAVAVAAAAAASKAAGAKKAKAAAAAEEEAREEKAKEDSREEKAKAWKRRCSECSKKAGTIKAAFAALLESIPAKGKLALRAGVLTHTRTPTHTRIRTPAHPDMRLE
jgi:hypothetical protein